MQKLFSTDGKIYSWMERFYQVLLLNIIFIITCLPLITIGAATAAAYGTTYKLIDHREGILYKEYLHQFKQNFIPATKAWFSMVFIILGSIGVLPYIRPFIINNRIAYYLIMVLVALIILTTLYLFPLIARFENTVVNAAINAMMLSLKHLSTSILLFFVTVGGIVLPFYVPKLFFAWLFVGVGMVFFINGKLLLRIFDRYENRN